MRLPRPRLPGRGYSNRALVAWAVVAGCFVFLAAVQVVSFWWQPAWAEGAVTVLGLVYWGAFAVAMFFRPAKEKTCIASISNLTEAQMYRYPETVVLGDQERPAMAITWINKHHVVITFNPDSHPLDFLVERVRKLTEVEEDVYGHSGVHGGESARAGKRFRLPQPGVSGA
jgi:hypothetical protein